MKNPEETDEKPGENHLNQMKLTEAAHKWIQQIISMIQSNQLWRN